MSDHFDDVGVRSVELRLTERELEVILLALTPATLKPRLHPSRYDAADRAETVIGAALRKARR